MSTPVQNPEAGFRYELQKVAPGLVLLLCCACLLLVGLIILYSAGLGESGPAQTFIRKQAVYSVVGASAMFLVWKMNLEWPRRLVIPIAIISAALLVSVLIPGVARSINGSRRWLDLGPVNMQVSDFAKIGLVFVLAHYLAIEQRRIHSFKRGYLVPLCIVGTAFLLIIKQPDFGTALLVGVVGGSMIFMAGARMLFILPTALLGAVLFSVAVYMDPVRLKRIMSFLDVEGNKSEGSYQLWQGILAFGSGGWSGVGLGSGRQQNSLPEVHTDFVFAIVGEELGFVWTSAVVLLFLTILSVAVMRLRHAPNMYQFLVVSGALLLLTLQALINFGVVTGCLPTKGMSLPFISYGGSNLVATCILVGIILNGVSRWGRVSNLTPNEVMRK
ncbi:MAG: cell division protein FtsW [Opitutales bacterium]|nr:cell division protein FtsW [Opitutales bacterium]